MAFDASTANPEASAFDPSTAEPENAAPARGMPATKFDPNTATPVDESDGDRLSNLGTLAKAALSTLPGIPGLRGLTKSPIPDAVAKPLEGASARILQTVSSGNPMDLTRPAPAGGTAEGIARTGGEFFRAMTTPLNIGLSAATGGLSRAAPIVARIAGGAMAAQMGGTSLSEIPEVKKVLDDPKSTTADKIAAVGGPTLGLLTAGLVGAHAILPMRPEFASAVEGKSPSEGLDALTKLSNSAKSPDALAAINKAKLDYISWWESTLAKDDQMRQSAEGLSLLNGKYSADEQAAQTRQRDFLRAQMEEVKSSIEQNQLGNADTAQAAEAGLVDPALQRRGRPAGGKVGPLKDDIPEGVELSDQAKKVAAEEGEQIPRAVLSNRESSQPASLVTSAGLSERPATATAAPREQAPAEFVGTETFGENGTKELYRLTKDITGGTAGQVVTRQTLERAGFDVPAAPESPINDQGHIKASASQDAKAGTAIDLTPGKNVLYTNDKGDSVPAKVIGEQAYGRVRILTDDGNAIRVPVERVKEGELAPSEAKPSGFDAATAEPDEIPAEVEMPAEQPVAPAEAKVTPNPEPAKRGRLRIGATPDGTPDLLNVIDELGWVRGPTKDAGGEYDGWAGAFGKGPARLLRNSKGQAIDQLQEELRNHGYNFQTPDDLYRGIETAIATRTRMRAAMKQAEMFQGGDQPFNLSSEKERAPQPEATSIEDPAQTDFSYAPGEHPFEGGHIDPKLLKHLATASGGASGAAYGFSTGKTPDEKAKRALEFGTLGALLGYGAGSLVTREGGNGNLWGYLKNRFTKEGIPNLRTASEAASDSAWRLASSRQWGKMQGIADATNNLGPKWEDPKFDHLIGSVTVQEMQLAKLNQLYADLNSAKTAAEKAAIQAHIASVKPVFDMPGTEIHNQEEFEAALTNPEVQAVLEKHKVGIQPAAEDRQRILGGRIAATGPNTGVFVNTEAMMPDEGTQPGSSSGGMRAGNLLNPRKQGSAMNRERTGTAEAYDLSYKNQVAKMAAGNAERAAKVDYYNTLEQEGLAQRTQPEDFKNWEKEPTSEYITTKDPLWIRKDIWAEHRKLMNTDSPIDSNAFKILAKFVNTVQLKGITDPVFHIANIESTLARSLGSKSGLGDLARQVSGVNILDANVRLASRLRDVIASDPEVLKMLRRVPGIAGDKADVPATRNQLAGLTQIGAMREDHPGFVGAVDRASRLAMDDMFQNLVDRGLAKDSEANRRDFINQIGQYNPRMMGKVKSFMKELGVSPFVVAGENFNRGARRALTGSPGVEAASGGARAKMVATNLAGTIVNLTAVPMAINYAISGKVAGPPGTPIGAIGWTDKDGQLHTIDPLKWTGLRRGLRITGINALYRDLKEGQDLNHAAGDAWQDIKNGAAQPYAGPFVNAISVLNSGKTIAGFQIAERANPLDRTEAPTADQAKNNGIAAIGQIQPQVAAALQGLRETPRGKSGTKEAGSNILKSLAAAGGYHESRTPYDSLRGSASSALYDDEKAKLDRSNRIADIAQKWPTMSRPEAIAATKDMNPLEVRSLLEEINMNAMGYSKSDKMMRSLGVEDGARAQFIAKQIMTLPSAERRQFLNDKMQKKLVNAKVAEQIAEELEQHSWHP